jgi:hypothetical protein
LGLTHATESASASGPGATPTIPEAARSFVASHQWSWVDVVASWPDVAGSAYSTAARLSERLIASTSEAFSPTATSNGRSDAALGDVVEAPLTRQQRIAVVASSLLVESGLATEPLWLLPNLDLLRTVVAERGAAVQLLP